MDPSETWSWVVNEYRGLLARRFDGLEPILRLTERIAATPQAEKLRAGMSMATLLISATDASLSHEPEPYIAVMVEPDEKRLRVQYRRNADGPLLVSRVCDESELDSVLHPLFIRLWNDTRKRV